MDAPQPGAASDRTDQISDGGGPCTWPAARDRRSLAGVPTLSGAPGAWIDRASMIPRHATAGSAVSWPADRGSLAAWFSADSSSGWLGDSRMRTVGVRHRLRRWELDANP